MGHRLVDGIFNQRIQNKIRYNCLLSFERQVLKPGKNVKHTDSCSRRIDDDRDLQWDINPAIFIAAQDGAD